MNRDRRDFIRLSAFSTLALGVSSKAQGISQDASPLPNAKQAKPITSQEYQDRQEMARRHMKDAGIDAVFLTGGSSLSYFTGTQWGISERLFALILPQRGEPVWVVPSFEKGRALEQIKF